MSSKLPISTREKPFCPICGNKGERVYFSLKDRMFAVPGEWSMDRCKNKTCQTFWLNPAPSEKDLPRLYENYSSHTALPYFPPQQHGIRKALNFVRAAYLSSAFGYERPRFSFLKYASYLHLAWRDAQAANIFYLPFVKNGKLLDIGCGNGANMQTMSALGWNVTGIDFDEKAVEEARKKTQAVYTGSLEEINFGNDSFDAIMMNHVIEHIPDPCGLLRECYRILKPGGVLVALTPNGLSWGHIVYKENWRGLETPHHLHIFNPSSLLIAGRSAPFSLVESFSSLQGTFYILEASHNLKQNNQAHKDISHGTLYKITKQIVWFLIGILHLFAPTKSEVAVLRCKK